jgi:hypothetical protein
VKKLNTSAIMDAFDLIKSRIYLILCFAHSHCRGCEKELRIFLSFYSISYFYIFHVHMYANGGRINERRNGEKEVVEK